MTVDETVAAVAERVAAQPPTAAEAEAAWTRVQLARHPQRPRTLDLVRRIFSDFTELAGDRAFRDDPAVHYKLGRLLQKHMNDGSDRVGRRSECIASYMTVLHLDNSDAHTNYTLAQIYDAEFGSSPATHALYKRAAELNPSSFVYQGGLAKSYADMGDRRQSEAHFAIATGLMRGN